MNKKLYFTLSMLFILLIALFLWPNSDVLAWSDPSCAPPGCNRPQPITVEGGTILSGNTLNVADGAEFTTGDIIIDSTGIEVGGKIEANKSGLIGKYYLCTSNVFGEISCNMEDIDTYVNTYFNELVVVDSDILITEMHTLNLSGGSSAIYVDEGRPAPWGYGVFSRAQEVGPGDYTVGIMGVVPDSNNSGTPIGVMGDASYVGFKGIGVYAVTDGTNGPYGMQETSGEKIALLAKDIGGAIVNSYAARFEGRVDVKLFRELDTAGTNLNDFVIKTSGDDWYKNVFHIQASPINGLDTITVDGDLYVGGYDRFGNEIGTHQICLNDDCITEWPSGQGGGTAIFKTINVDNGTDPQAASASDTLNIIDGANINVVGFDGNNNQDSITINVNTTLTDIVQINSVSDDFLYLNGGDAEGVYVYDKLTVDGDVQVNELTANCANVTTNAQKELTCGIDAVNDADSSASNEIQDLDSVLKVGATSTMDMGTGSIIIGAGETLCINKACLTEAQLVELLKLIP